MEDTKAEEAICGSAQLREKLLQLETLIRDIAELRNGCSSAGVDTAVEEVDPMELGLLRMQETSWRTKAMEAEKRLRQLQAEEASQASEAVPTSQELE
eukprot:682688-Amphidinium_carterae.2